MSRVMRSSAFDGNGKSRKSFKISDRNDTSSIDVGSSAMRTFGLARTALAIDTR